MDVETIDKVYFQTMVYFVAYKKILKIIGTDCKATLFNRFKKLLMMDVVKSETFKSFTVLT